MVGKYTTDPQIILKWSLIIFFLEFFVIILGLFDKNTKNKKINTIGK